MNRKIDMHRYVLILLILLMSTQYAYASFSEEIYISVKPHEVTQDDIEKIETHDVIRATNDLSIPKCSLLSIDINNKGELLVCFTSKIIVFNKDFKPIRAYFIDWGKGGRPFAIWNKTTNNVIYVRGDGYEFDKNGIVEFRYELSNPAKHKKKRVVWQNRVYELQNRTFLPNLSSNKEKAYSTLVVMDNKGKTSVLYEYIKPLVVEILIDYILIVSAIAIMISIIIKKQRKKKLHQLRYCNFEKNEPYKKVYVNARPRAVLKKK